MPDLPCCYIFSSLPQERKVRYSLGQRFSHNFNTAVKKLFLAKNPETQGNKSSPWWSWHSSVSLSLDMRDPLQGTEPKLNSSVCWELLGLQAKQRWGNAPYPHPWTYPELPIPSQKKKEKKKFPRNEQPGF